VENLGFLIIDKLNISLYDLVEVSMTSDPEVIMAVARKLLNVDGQANIETYLAYDGPEVAVWGILGAIDARRSTGQMTEKEAETFYEELKITAKESAKARRYS
jgi:hypothetical protein